MLKMVRVKLYGNAFTAANAMVGTIFKLDRAKLPGDVCNIECRGGSIIFKILVRSSMVMYSQG